MKTLVAFFCFLLLAAASFAPPMVSEDAPSFTESQPERIVVAYYFYNTIRCNTCMKLEAYARETIQENFSDELAAGTLMLQMKNLDEAENKHFIDDYKLFTKALVLVNYENGEQSRWQNCAKIWELVGDEEKYKRYIRDEITAFLEG